MAGTGIALTDRMRHTRILFISAIALPTIAGCDPEPFDDDDAALLEETDDDALAVDDYEALPLGEPGPAQDDADVDPTPVPAADADIGADIEPQEGYWFGWQPIVQVNSGLCLDSAGESPGTLVRQSWCHFSQRQQWKFINLGGGWYQIQNQRSGLCLDNASGWLTTQHCVGYYNSQKFRVHDPSTPGLVMFESKATPGLCFGIPLAQVDPTSVHGTMACEDVTYKQWVVVVPDGAGYACGV